VIDAALVTEILRDCLFTDEEMPNPELPEGAVYVEGIMNPYGFHPERLESHREEVRGMLDQLNPAFRASVGGGWHFTQMPFTVEGEHWGEHPNCEQLMVLAIGLGLMQYLLPREMWSATAGVPYLVYMDKEQGDRDPAATQPTQ
jgi:hypothetical protein